MDETEDDRALVLRAKNGSEEAFSSLVRRYHERVYRIAFRIIRNPEDAEEVTQEVFVRAYQALDRFDFRAAFYTWLVSIARNAAFDALRSLQRRARVHASTDGVEDMAAAGTGDPVRSSVDHETAAKLKKALGRLNARDRALIVLREYEDLQYEEIARVLGCSVGTVESGLHRARKRLKDLLGDWTPG